MSSHGLTFYLYVTGEGEEKFLPLLFQSLRNIGFNFSVDFNFKVKRRFPQLRPRQKDIEQLRVIRTNGLPSLIHSRDEELGTNILGLLRGEPQSFAIIIDDLEHSGKEQALEIFNRYKNALDHIITKPEMRRRASIHFLVMMLEAYYFADSQAVNHALHQTVLEHDLLDDVETIRNPYSKLKQLYQGFDKVRDGEKIISKLQIDHVLSNPNTCASLRTLFAWCVEVIREFYPEFQNDFSDYHLEDGIQYAVTNGQLSILRRDSRQ